LGFAACVSEASLPAARLLESSNQAGNAEHGAAGSIFKMQTEAFHVLLLMKLENYWQGEQAKCL